MASSVVSAGEQPMTTEADRFVAKVPGGRSVEVLTAGPQMVFRSCSTPARPPVSRPSGRSWRRGRPTACVRSATHGPGTATPIRSLDGSWLTPSPEARACACSCGKFEFSACLRWISTTRPVDSRKNLVISCRTSCATGRSGSRNLSPPKAGQSPGRLGERSGKPGDRRLPAVPDTRWLPGSAPPPSHRFASAPRPGEAPPSHTWRGLRSSPATSHPLARS